MTGGVVCASGVVAEPCDTGGNVTDVLGTANQITATPSGTVTTLSIPNDFRAPGSIQAAAIGNITPGSIAATTISTTGNATIGGNASVTGNVSTTALIAGGATGVTVDALGGYGNSPATVHSTSAWINLGVTNGVDVFGATNAGNSHAYISNGELGVRSTFVIGFTAQAGDAATGLGAQDTSLSRVSAGNMAVGSGAFGSTAANLWAATVRTISGNQSFAALPSASAAGAGARGYVNDGNATLLLGLGNPAAGGGANKNPVYSDGTTWRYGG